MTTKVTAGKPPSTQQVCRSLLGLGTDKMNEISRVLSNPSDYDPEDVKSDKQLSDGFLECKSVKDPRELGRRLENNIMDQLAVNQHCAGACLLTSNGMKSSTAN